MALLGSRGPTTITDHDDGWLAFGLVGLVCVAIGTAGVGLVVAAVRSLLVAPAGALVGASLGAGMAWLAQWYLRRRMRVMQVTRAGALVVPCWPLVGGERIQIAYQRPILDPACELRSLRAELVLIETCMEYDRHEQRYESHDTTLCRLDLGGGGRQTPEGLHAIFGLTVPPPDGGCPRRGLDAFKALFGLGRARVWWLRVTHDVAGLTDTDSRFRVRIAPGRAPARPGRRREAA